MIELFEPGMRGGALYGAVLSASLLGSVHCAGMCGPLVAVYSALAGKRDVAWHSHAVYHGVRGAAYVGLGATAGLLGHFIDGAGEFAGLSRVAGWISGALVVLWGISAAFPRLKVASPVAKHLAPRLAKLGTKPRVFRAAALGVLTPMLPCGWLYAFVVAAAGTGRVIDGGLLMLFFWLGTVPALLGMGAVLSRVGDRFRRRLPLLTGIALIVIGTLGLVTRFERTSGLEHGESTAQTRPSCH